MTTTALSSVARETAVVEAVPKGLWIDGDARAAAGGRVLPVDDPSTGEILAEVADASVEDGLAALDAAVAAQARWAATAPRERGEILRRAFELMTARADDLALLMTLEMGKPLVPSRAARSLTRPSSSGGSARRRSGSPVAGRPRRTGRPG
jgi:succinate-semialdehyde dehydrogenase/glutarate-semialdehyde dehydrogenase